MAGSLEHPLYRCLIKTKKANYKRFKSADEPYNVTKQ